MPSTFQLLRAGNGKIVRSASGKPFGNNVSAAATSFANTARRRMPYAVSRDLQPAVIAGKELYFRVTHSDLRTVANGGLSQTGFDFQFETVAGAVVPYVVKSYDPVAGTLFGVFKNDLAGSAAATKGYLYFNAPSWTTSREDPLNTLPNCLSALFLPSGVDYSDAGLDFNADLPTSDKTLVNPGALLNGSTDYIWRGLSNPINTFLISVYCQDLDANSDNALWAFGLEAGNTVIFIRRLFGTAAQHTGGETNAWRFGWVTTEPGVPGTVSSFYETKSGSSGTGLQHVVIRRFTDGTDPEVYLNGVLEPIVFKFTDLAASAAQRGPIATTGQRILLGRGSTATRFWHGYLDCFKFYSGTNRTATWAKSEYTNLLDIDGAVIFGDPETVSTATMFGETIDITCNGLSSLTFAADKYVTNDTPLTGSPPATPSIQSLVQPAGGSLTVTTGNNVQYANTSNTDPDNAGSVVMTNGSGTVKVPIRAKIVPSVVITPSGYYKTPNIATKTAVSVGSLGSASTPNTLLWAFAQFNLGTFSSATHYIKVTGQIDSGVAKGKDILVTAGGTATHPLVIMAAHTGGADVWTSIPKVKDCCLRLQRQWIWCYGLWSEMLPISQGVQPPNQATWNTTGNTACYSPEANNCFVTCCRMSASQGIWHETSTAILTSFTANYNWYEIAAQQRDPNNAVGASTSDFGYRTGEANGKTITNLTHMYNRYSDHASSLTNASKNFRAVIIGNGNVNGLREPSTGTEIGYNFINARCSHPMEFKNIPDYVHHNHAPLNNRVPPAGFNTRGGNADGPPSGKRPLFLANRIKCAQQEVNNGFADYVSHYLTDDANVVTGHLRLMPTGTAAPGKKGISGADGTNWVACRADVVVGDNLFEPTNYTYGNLGTRADVVFAGHLAGAFTDSNGTTCAFNGYPPGTMTGTHPNIIESAIIKRTGSLSFTPEVPPILSATICGPNDSGGTGKVWGT